ncbi:FAD-dependent oxidoreductase, partial [Streptomyces sp. NPDC057927]
VSGGSGIRFDRVSVAYDGTTVHRQRVRDGVWLVTGPGGRGMTCSPAIAETTANELGW